MDFADWRSLARFARALWQTAREYGIPAVLGTQVSTAQFKNGDIISVDGQNGEVKLVI
jgi:phosphohistidine swiveling domain-containing protein